MPVEASYQYRNVGLNVTCRAWKVEGGFRLDLDVERSSIAEPVEDHPSFHTFNASSELVLQDGETVGLVSSADGSLLRIALQVSP